MFHLSKDILESVILVSGMSTLWEDIDGCAKQYMCNLYIYLLTALSSSYFIIMEFAINAPVGWKNVVYVLNATYECYLK